MDLVSHTLRFQYSLDVRGKKGNNLAQTEAEDDDADDDDAWQHSNKHQEAKDVPTWL